MEDAIIFQRRNRLKRHFVNTSNVLLYCYRQLSDCAKITYQVIDGFDWESKTTQDSKGYAFPAVATLAKIRNTSVRTIRRHIAELEKVQLLTRQRRRNRPSILYIEEIVEAEIDTYLALFVDKRDEAHTDVGEQGKSRTDKNGRSQSAQRTKMAVAIQKEDEVKKKENENNVNERKRVEADGMASLGVLLKQYRLKPAKQLQKPDATVKRDYLAEQIADQLNDRKSLGCYRIIAAKIPSSVIFEVLGSVKETANAQKIRQSKGALFVEIIKRYARERGIRLGFKQQNEREKSHSGTKTG